MDMLANFSIFERDNDVPPGQKCVQGRETVQFVQEEREEEKDEEETIGE